MLKLSNCYIEAWRAKRRNPAVIIRAVRNKAGRKHWQWIEDGQVYEFYGKGASQRSYLGNLLYRGKNIAVGPVEQPSTRRGKEERATYIHHDPVMGRIECKGLKAYEREKERTALRIEAIKHGRGAEVGQAMGVPWNQSQRIEQLSARHILDFDYAQGNPLSEASRAVLQAVVEGIGGYTIETDGTITHVPDLYIDMGSPEGDSTAVIQAKRMANGNLSITAMHQMQHTPPTRQQIVAAAQRQLAAACNVAKGPASATGKGNRNAPRIKRKRPKGRPYVKSD